MGLTYLSLHYHLVFGTKNRERPIDAKRSGWHALGVPRTCLPCRVASSFQAAGLNVDAGNKLGAMSRRGNSLGPGAATKVKHAPLMQLVADGAAQQARACRRPGNWLRQQPFRWCQPPAHAQAACKVA